MVWELYLPYPNIGLLAFAFGTDKAIASHTKGYVKSQQGYTYQRCGATAIIFVPKQILREFDIRR